MILDRYDVFNLVGPGDDKPFKVVRTQLQLNKERPLQEVTYTIIGGHSVRPLAFYWAAMLNEGRYTEDQVWTELSK